MATKTRHALTLEQGIDYYDMHSAADRVMVAGIVAEAGATAAYRPANADYVAFRKGARVVAYLHPGYLTVLDCAAVTVDRDPVVGRAMVSTANGKQGWDLYLSTWEGAAPHAGGARQPASANGGREGKPQAVSYGSHDVCGEEGCMTWVRGAEYMCRRHAAQYV